jgi:thiol-disulfide isomerase/thioredoxin
MPEAFTIDSFLIPVRAAAVLTSLFFSIWATWCPPCRREMPLLDAIQDEYQEQ